ncbi:hypothetical protein PR003_g25740 [Phytophthora rubi]|uniref:PEP-utilising enzyme C-terminal domain-containing protein n=1 Tax=Phytophthora rubi TaxID=129364 RepID=A0A6A4CBX3_9STRA|nr:hypothetical protein PR002_g12397 [Phytophthora rubi]KAE9288699.1 hypothetical protein PR003_g25740 [Phytophthora rubi]
MHGGAHDRAHAQGPRNARAHGARNAVHAPAERLRRHTLEPPLHEFLAQKGSALDELCEMLSKEMKVSKVLVQSRMSGLKEANPMMGLRGNHLGITEMQTKAIAEAFMKVAGEGISVHPHIMIPLVDSFKEVEQ